MIGTEELLISTNFFLEQKFYTAQLQHEQANQFQTPTIVKSPEKQPSKLGILILVLITILLYSLGINQSSKIVTQAIIERVGTKYSVFQ
ncbi:MAG: hypothetical protein AB4206_01755 [Xenococcaceae cyanobacterium]